MRKAKKKIHPMPKLGWKDQFLYWSVMAAFGCIAIVSFAYPLIVRDNVAYGDLSVIATDRDLAPMQFLWIFLWCITAIILIVIPYRKRIPVFGRPDIKYGPPAYPRIFPLLMKDKPQYWRSPKKVAWYRKMLQIAGCLMTLWLAVGLCFYPQSVYARADLRSNGTITVMNGHNMEEKQYRFGDVERVEVKTDYTRKKGRSTRSWYIQIAFYMKDGKIYIYRNSEFRGDWTETLQSMLAVKDRYFGLLTIKGEENLENVIRYQGLTEQEAALLYELFDAEPRSQ